MGNMTTVEVKAFVPARDFQLSKRFYQDLGFGLAWSSDDLAYLRHGNSSFLLQNFYSKCACRNRVLPRTVKKILRPGVEAILSHARFVSNSLITDVALFPTLATAASISSVDLSRRFRQRLAKSLVEISTRFRNGFGLEDVSMAALQWNYRQTANVH